MARKLGVGIVGCGLMGGIHAAGYAKDARVKLIGCQNRSRDKAAALAAKHGAKVYETLDELLADPAIDAVSICSSQQVHHEQGRAALLAGKHLLLEKPLALTLPEMDELAALATASGRTVMVAHQLRFHPVIKAVHQALPKLGRLIHLHLECGFLIRGHEGRCWRDYRSGGFFMELGCHLVDLARHLMGEIRHVQGVTLRTNPLRVTEDFTQSLLQFTSGAVGDIIVSANHRVTRQGLFQGRIIGEHGRLEFTFYPYQRTFNQARLILDGGKDVFVPDSKGKALTIKRGPSPSAVYPGFFDVYEQETRAFVTSVLRKTPPPVTLADGRAAVAGVLATYAAQGLVTREANFPALAALIAMDGACHPLLGSLD
jgi:predicted dehydrogenase